MMKYIKQILLATVMFGAVAIANAEVCNFPTSENEAPGWVCGDKVKGVKESDFIMLGIGDSSTTALVNALDYISKEYNYRVQKQIKNYDKSTKTPGPETKNINSYKFGKIKLDSMIKHTVKLDSESNEINNKIEVTRLKMGVAECKVEIKLYREKMNQLLRQTQNIELINCTIQDVIKELQKVNIRPVAYAVDPATNEHYVAVSYK